MVGLSSSSPVAAGPLFSRWERRSGEVWRWAVCECVCQSMVAAGVCWSVMALVDIMVGASRLVHRARAAPKTRHLVTSILTSLLVCFHLICFSFVRFSVYYVQHFKTKAKHNFNIGASSASWRKYFPLHSTHLVFVHFVPSCDLFFVFYFILFCYLAHS